MHLSEKGWSKGGMKQMHMVTYRIALTVLTSFPYRRHPSLSFLGQYRRIQPWQSISERALVVPLLRSGHGR